MLTPDSIRHALSRHIPDMERGFSIVTNYGEVTIPGGPVAERITRLVADLLAKELLDLEHGTAKPTKAKPANA